MPIPQFDLLANAVGPKSCQGVPYWAFSRADQTAEPAHRLGPAPAEQHVQPAAQLMSHRVSRLRHLLAVLRQLASIRRYSQSRPRLIRPTRSVVTGLAGGWTSYDQRATGHSHRAGRGCRDRRVNSTVEAIERQCHQPGAVYGVYQQRFTAGGAAEKKPALGAASRTALASLDGLQCRVQLVRCQSAGQQQQRNPATPQTTDRRGWLVTSRPRANATVLPALCRRVCQQLTDYQPSTCAWPPGVLGVLQPGWFGLVPTAPRTDIAQGAGSRQQFHIRQPAHPVSRLAAGLSVDLRHLSGYSAAGTPVGTGTPTLTSTLAQFTERLKSKVQMHLEAGQ